MAFHASNVSNGNKGEKLNTTHSLHGFQADNVSNKNQAKELYITDSLDRVSSRECQQQISSKATAHNLLSEQYLMQEILAKEIKKRSCTQLTIWVEFHIGNISNRNQVEELYMTHSLDRSVYRQYQQQKLSKKAAYDSLPRQEFVQAMSAMKIKQESHT